MTTPSPTFPLLSLPNEVILDIAEYLDLASTKSLHESSRYLYTLLTPLFERFIADDPDTVLYWAIKTRQVKVARLAVDKGALLDFSDENGMYPLHEAAWAGCDEIVTLLLDRGAEIECTSLYDDGYGTYGGETPLSLAAANSKESTAKLLVTRGADIHAVESDGRSILGNAAMGGSVGVVRYLLEMGCDVSDSSEKVQCTALYYAVIGGFLEIVRLLLGGVAGATPPMDRNEGEELSLKGLDIDMQDSSGRTALFLALENWRSDIVYELLARGANPNIARNGKTPLSLAIESGDEALVKALVENGADTSVDLWDNEPPVSRNLSPALGDYTTTYSQWG